MSLLKAACTSMVVMGAGDVMRQTILARKPPVQAIRKIDAKRAGMFSFIGLTLHGPFFYKGFQWLENAFGSQKTLRVVATKATVGQLTIFPLYLTAFFMYSSMLEGGTAQEAVKKTREKFWPSFVVGTMFWPLVNLTTFKYVPLHSRVMYVGVAGIFWNTFLSWQQSQKLQEDA